MNPDVEHLRIQPYPISMFLEGADTWMTAEICGLSILARDLYSSRYDKLRERITKARKEAGLSQKELGAKIKRPPSYVTDFERAERRINVIEFIALAEAIGFDPLEILADVISASGA